MTAGEWNVSVVLFLTREIKELGNFLSWDQLAVEVPFGVRFKLAERKSEGVVSISGP